MQTHRIPVICSTLLLMTFFSVTARADVVWTASQGTTAISFDQEALSQLGLRVSRSNDSSSATPLGRATLDLSAGDAIQLSTEDGHLKSFDSNRLHHEEGIHIAKGDFESYVLDFRLNLPSSVQLIEENQESRNAVPSFELNPIKVSFDVERQKLLAEGMEVVISEALARQFNDASLAGMSIGSFTLEAELSWVGGDAPSPRPEVDTERGGNGGTVCDGPGTDVIVGDLIDVSNYSSLGGMEAFAVGTTSCNIGSENLQWVASTNEHPVISQNMYRLKDGRYEQVGQSWLKHGFTALTQNICGCGCSGQGGSVLGVGCSDPYCCGLNGSQARLGPRSEVNAHTGFYPYPFTDGDQGSTGDSTYKRLQVPISDLDPAQDGGGTYFVEGHYIASDDAADGNGDNNASYRQITVSGSGSSWSISLASTTQREQPGIRAWQDSDPSVVETDVRILNEGLVILAAKTTDLGGGMWHYEYAVQNLNSDRSIHSFSVPIDPTANVSNIGFNDVHSHSGEPYDLTDWPGSKVGSAVVWQTDDFGTNPNANAIRWSTMYNFRFDADRGPQATQATLGIFKPGTPTAVLAATTGPIGIVDCNSNAIADPSDIANGDSLDCDLNSIPDECQTFTDVPIATIQVATGLASPVAVAAPPGDPDRLFIVEQNSGQIKILKSGAVLGTPFLNIGSLITSGGERGLLSVAFHPNYASNGFFYVNYTNTSGNTTIARYTVSGDPDIADAGSALIILTVNQDFANHNGGQLQFGPDGYLYIGMGDGGSGDDPFNNAQDLGSLLGKILRLDVDAAAPYIPAGNKYGDEIWSVGLRNPWRFSFDRLTGDMFIGDVGQDAREEINFEPAGTDSGVNYGWDCREGLIPTPSSSGGYGCVATDPTLTDPILDVRHSGDPTHPGFICSIIGGYVYRGCDIPSLHGTYFYADYCGNWIFSIKYDGATVTEQTDRTPELGPLSSIVAFGEDGLGEMYIVAGSSVHKIVPVDLTPVCGDGNQDPGEECDDGNTTPGDGCDENCDIETADDCVNASPIFDGPTPYSTVGATTDGPAHAACAVDGDGGVTVNDIWFIYDAECTGTLTASTCNAVNYDSDLVIYEGTDCGDLTGSLLACNDDGPGCSGFTSILNAPVIAGHNYLLRVGGWANNEQGSGTITLTNSGAGCEVCPTTSGDGDGDCDIDLNDYMQLQQCFTGDIGSGPQVFPTGCACFDTDGDGDVDGNDYTALGAMTGPDSPAAGCTIP
jgi:cysteine-rich repeat protein